jgi:hypothetical protein
MTAYIVPFLVCSAVALAAFLLGRSDWPRQKKDCLFTESYKGEVIHVCTDNVVIAFEVDDDLEERTYSLAGFLRRPEKGECVIVSAQLCAIVAQETLNKPRQPRKNVVPLPRTF